MKKLRKNFLLSLLFLIFSFSKACAEGRLYLVSTGVGDLDNLTLRAYEVIQKADIVFCSKWSCERMKDLIKGKEVYDAGFGIFHLFYRKEKEISSSEIRPHDFNREEKKKELEKITKIVRTAVKQGKVVAVLDEGDPTVYGPHIWYMEAFKDLNPEIVPGVSSFNAANAAIKKSLTGGKTLSITLASGFSDLESLAKTRTNLVLFTMRIKDIAEVLKKIEKYYSPKTQVIFVLYAGYKEKERVIAGTFEDIYEKIKGIKLPFEYLVYIGDFGEI
ncbi:tetrapyrrole methylase [Thermodesulfobacterium sp. TA1]|uniref:SAM-dependent methyltransferase n=1 Tax=Thermodesulfobacterium sp. TA1 TaxID=2234087 RepID=UPI001232EC69|nr:SAM-dependent methyltransferase [Thermodesulfobacterium sp. TA1]QER42222.1 tetrapyrrole methylase [Thermodesulfobacterium sp. TA1]